MSAQKGTTLIKLLIPIVLIIGALAYLNYSNIQQTRRSNTEQTKTYESKSLQFSVRVPTEFTIKDSDLAVDFISTDGNISVIRNGTNFSDLNSYITDFDSKRKITSDNSQNININGYNSVARIVRLPGGDVKQKSYYIYIDNAVYILTTSSESLYSSLDQIARSFRYTP